MPIHLAPLSRRRFLSRSAQFIAAIGLAPTLLARGTKADPNTWALLADIHIAADRTKTARNINMTDHLATVIRELMGARERVAGVVVNGDCALNSGEIGDYTTLSELVVPMRTAQFPVHFTLGNHDDRFHFDQALTKTGNSEGAAFQKYVSILKSPRANLFLLDSLDKTLVTPGILGEEQRKWLAKALDANPDKPAVVFAHHDLEGKPGSLRDGEQLLEILRPRKHVKAYVYGHTHRWNVMQDTSGIHLVNLPPVAYIFREGDPNGWVHATLQRNGMRLALQCLDKKHTQHRQTVDLDWRKG